MKNKLKKILKPLQKTRELLTTFLYLIYKDLKVFTRRKASLTLVLISPIIIMILLGTTYSVGTDLMQNSNIRGINMAVCDYDDAHISRMMIQELKNSTFFEMEYYDHTFYTEQQCKNKVVNDLYEGKHRVAIIFHKNFTQKMLNGQSQELEFYVDNSHTEVRNTVHIFMLAYAHEVSREVGAKFIQEVWNKLSTINTELTSMTQQLDTIQESAETIKQNLASSQAQLKDFNTQEVSQTINNLDNQINRVEEARTEISTAVDETQTDINTASNQIEDMRTTTNNAKTEITNTRQKIDNVLTPLTALHSTLLVLNETVECPSTLCTQLQIALNSTSTTITELQTTRNELTTLENSLNDVNTNLDQQQELLQRTKNKVDQAEQVVEDVEPELYSVQTQVGSLRNTMQEVEEIKQESNQFFNQADTNIDQVITDLDSVSPEINRAKQALTTFTQYNPSNIVQPLHLKGVDIYKNRRYIDFMMPGIIGLVVMFSCLLLASISIVKEKKSGVFTRTFLTPTPLILTLLARTTSNLILAGIQITILLGVGILLFNIKLQGEIIHTLIAGEAVSLSFLTVGLMLGAFSKSENTSILASIAIGLPMLFLCGLLFPTELMPTLMRLISSFLPLTYGIDALRNIIVYGSQIKDVIPAMSLLIGQSIIAFLISVKILERI